MRMDLPILCKFMGIKKEDMGLRSETITDMIWTRLDKEL